MNGDRCLPLERVLTREDFREVKVRQVPRRQSLQGMRGGIESVYENGLKESEEGVEKKKTSGCECEQDVRTLGEAS